MFVVSCWLFAVCYSRCVVLVVCCLLSAVRCLLLVGWLLVGGCLVVGCLLSIVGCLLFIVGCFFHCRLLAADVY